MKILYAADLHIGANKFGVDSNTWNSPLWDIVEYVKENDVEWVVVCGDAFHKRHPTTDELDTYREWVHALGGYGAVVVDIAGNHDYGVRADSLPASDFFDEVFTYRGRVQGLTLKSGNGQPGLQIVCVPWPRMVDYPMAWEANKPQPSIDVQLRIAAQQVEAAIERAVDDFDGQSIIAGHLHVWYGGSSNRRDVDGPGLMMGRDILVSHSRLSGIPNMIDLQLGHIHNPGNGYVGSTQPTDFADTNPKSFVVVDYEIENDPSGEFGAMWNIADWQRVPYLSSLKVKSIDITSEEAYALPDPESEPPYDIVRGTLTMWDDNTAPAHAWREYLEKWGKTVIGATVIPYRGESRSAALDADGLDLSDPRVAVGAWLAERKIEDRELELEVRYEVDSLLTTATAGD